MSNKSEAALLSRGDEQPKNQVRCAVGCKGKNIIVNDRWIEEKTRLDTEGGAYFALEIEDLVDAED